MNFVHFKGGGGSILWYIEFITYNILDNIEVFFLLKL